MENVKQRSHIVLGFGCLCALWITVNVNQNNNKLTKIRIFEEEMEKLIIRSVLTNIITAKVILSVCMSVLSLSWPNKPRQLW